MNICLPSRILEQVQGRPIRHVVSVSGGKDSTATYLLAFEHTGGDFDAVFADTGNEHEATDEVVRWSMTMWGGKQFDMLAYAAPPISEVCIYAGGLCE